MEERILFLGNGYDIGRGLKTSYKDFLKYYNFMLCNQIIEDYLSFYESKFFTRMSSSISRYKKFNNEIYKKIINKIINKILNKSLFNTSSFIMLKDIITEEQFYEILKMDDSVSFFNYLNDISASDGQELLYSELLYFKYNQKIKLEDLKEKSYKGEVVENKWIEYFLHLYYLNDDLEIGDSPIQLKGSWASLEEVIKENFVNENQVNTFDQYHNVNYSFAKNKWLSFSQMKGLLYIYIEGEFKDKKDNQHEFLQREKFANYKNIVSFNYTNLLSEYKELKIEYIHGQLDDGERIVFGFDENEYFNSTEKRVSNNMGIDYTKVNQLIVKNTYNKQLKRNFENNLFTEVKYKTLGIYGHSIGECDFSYFANIIKKNIEKIEVIVYYYDDQQAYLQRALYKLFSYIEKTENRSIYHDMVISGRIQFRHYSQI